MPRLRRRPTGRRPTDFPAGATHGFIFQHQWYRSKHPIPDPTRPAATCGTPRGSEERRPRRWYRRHTARVFLQKNDITRNSAGKQWPESGPDSRHAGDALLVCEKDLSIIVRKVVPKSSAESSRDDDSLDVADVEFDIPAHAPFPFHIKVLFVGIMEPVMKELQVTENIDI